MSSFRLSVTLVDQDHIGRKSWNLTARPLSLTSSLFVAQRPHTYSQGNIGKLGETRGGVGKMAFWSTKAAISLKRVKIREKVTTVGTHLRSFEQYHPRPLRPPLLQDWEFTPQPKLQSVLSRDSGTGRATNFKFGRNNNSIRLNNSPGQSLEKRKRLGVAGDCPLF